MGLITIRYKNPAVGDAILQLIAAIEVLGGINEDVREDLVREYVRLGGVESDIRAKLSQLPKYRTEDLQLSFDPNADERPGAGSTAPKVHYIAKLPTLPDGRFDMDAVARTVRENLEELGASTVKGIVYQEIVDATLKGIKITEPEIRNRRMLKAGSSQGAIQTMRAQGKIDSLPIVYGS